MAWTTVFIIIIVVVIALIVVLGLTVFNTPLRGNVGFKVDIQDPTFDFSINNIVASFFNVNWGDGSKIEKFENWDDSISHTYKKKGVYTITISSAVDFQDFDIRDTEPNYIVGETYFEGMIPNAYIDIYDQQKISGLDVSGLKDSLYQLRLRRCPKIKYNPNLSNYTVFNYLNVEECPLVKNINVSNNTSIAELAIETCDGLQIINASNCINLDYVYIYGNNVTPMSIDLSGCTNFNQLDGIYSNAALTSVNLSGCTNLGDDNYVYVIDNQALTNINIDGCTNMGNDSFIYFDNNALSESSVNAILVNLDNFGFSNGYMNISGGTNAAPDGDALSALDPGKGWTITHN